MANNPKAIFVHCTATAGGRDFSAADIDRWHRDRGWSGIGYHKVVRIGGTVENGRDPDRDGDVEEHVGAHTLGFNQDSLAVVYVGGIDSAGKPFDTRTSEQRVALRAVVRDWMARYGIPVTKVFGHYEKDPGKACPSFDMGAFRTELMRHDAAPAAPEMHLPTLTLNASGQAVRLLNALLAQPGDLELVHPERFSTETLARLARRCKQAGIPMRGAVGSGEWQALIAAAQATNRE